MINQAELKELLEYNSDSGKFTWVKLSSKYSNIKLGSIAGTLLEDGYRVIRIHGKPYMAHRLAWLYITGNHPDDQIDHLNGIRDDNRFVNLREVSPSENCRNSKHRSSNTSGHIGVNIDDRNSVKWIATIKVNGKKIYLGRFPTKDEAIEARKKAEIKYGFHSNHGRRI